MRLLHIKSDEKLELTKDIIRAEDIPRYAILSHTWGRQEVTIDDLRSVGSMKDGEAKNEAIAKKKEGWDKIRFCAAQAKRDDIDHFWVDTCCIDKANYTELSEAINSMFRWYQNAKRCYVFLPDVKSQSPKEDSRLLSEWEATFKASRWFTRGWTLQELLAPRSVEFFSKDGARLGDRDSLKQSIHETTKIPIKALSGNDLSDFKIDERFRWGKHRQTEREEDGAYCLLGILNCYLPLIYGEGKENAFKRLKKEMLEGETLSKMHKWLSPPDPSTNYQKAHKQRQAGTGIWLLQCQSFKIWKMAAASRLWLYGIPGCGKTILSSTVIEHLQQQCDDDSDKVTVYFFFDFNDAQKRLPELMLRSLLYQLLERSKTIPDFVITSCSACERGQQPPSLQQLLKSVKQMMSLFSHVYIVLDALDECSQRPELMDILETMSEWQLAMVHLLMASREERDIQTSLKIFVKDKNAICLQRNLVDRDILRYIQQRLRDDEALAKWNNHSGIIQVIETTLMRGAHGMFRWVICQLDTVAKCRSPAMLRKSLATLPSTLDQTYEQILTAIREEDCTYATRILQWLTFSARPLTLEEVAEIVAIDAERTPAFDRDEVLADPLEVLNICSSLVTMTVKETSPSLGNIRHLYTVVTLAHYSVREYLVSERIKQGPAKQYSMNETECHGFIARDCLGYLQQFQRPVGRGTYGVLTLARYAAEFWSSHIQKTGDREKEVSQLAMGLMSTKSPTYANWIRIYDPDVPWTSRFLSSKKLNQEDIPAPLYYAALLGLSTIANLLLTQGVEVDVRGGSYGNPLHAALARGHLAVAKLLINANADVNIRGKIHPSALILAYYRDYKEVFQLLITAGADANIRDQNHRSLLQLGSHRGDEAMVKLLITAGADVNASGNEVFGNALGAAIYGAHAAVVKLLILAGADVDARYGTGWNALQAASIRGYETIVKLLIEAGTEVNAPGAHDFPNALEGASSRGYTGVVKLLIDAGADINAEGATGSCALHTAFRCAHEATAILLVERGANVGPDSWSRGALHHALDSAWCTPPLVNALQQHGAPLNTTDIDNMTPLHYCVKFEHKAIAKQLLDAGAHVDSGACRQACCSSVSESRNDQVDTTPSVSAPVAIGPTPLHFAALKGKAGMTRFLLDHGADPNTPTRRGETPLHLALRATVLDVVTIHNWNVVVSGDILARDEVIDTLLASPTISLTATDHDGESYLHCIRYGEPGSAILIQRLASRGADVSAFNSSQQSPLHLAIRCSDRDSVRVLLDMGANVSLTDGNGLNALHCAAQHKDDRILMAILESDQAKAINLAISKDTIGQNVLHHILSRRSTAEVSQLALIEWLIYQGANASELDDCGLSPLARFIESSADGVDMGILKTLLRIEGTASFVNHHGQTLGHLCTKIFGFGLLLLQTLNEYNVHLTQKDRNGKTVLHCVVEHGTLTEDILDYLVNVIGIKIDEQDARGRTALQYAIEAIQNKTKRRAWLSRRWKDTRDILANYDAIQIGRLSIDVPVVMEMEDDGQSEGTSEVEDGENDNEQASNAYEKDDDGEEEGDDENKDNSAKRAASLHVHDHGPLSKRRRLY